MVANNQQYQKGTGELLQTLVNSIIDVSYKILYFYGNNCRLFRLFSGYFGSNSLQGLMSSQFIIISSSSINTMIIIRIIVMLIFWFYYYYY